MRDGYILYIVKTDDVATVLVNIKEQLNRL